MLFAALARPAAQLYLEFFDDPAVVTPLARSVVGPAVKKKFCAANEKTLLSASAGAAACVPTVTRISKTLEFHHSGT